MRVDIATIHHVHLNPVHKRARHGAAREDCRLKTLLRLQDLDVQIEACRDREQEIPKQKNKFNVQRQRLQEEINEREQVYKGLQVEQRTCESEIEQLQGQVAKYQDQLLKVKKNDEYQALTHEIDGLKKQMGAKEERIIALMLEIDTAKARLDEDKQRISDELAEIDRECSAIDIELEEAIASRHQLEAQRTPLEEQVDAKLRRLYDRIRTKRPGSRAVVSLRGEFCSGCNMKVLPQVVNEVLAGELHTCNHCGRILYDGETLDQERANAQLG